MQFYKSAGLSINLQSHYQFYMGWNNTAADELMGIFAAVI